MGPVKGDLHGVTWNLDANSRARIHVQVDQLLAVQFREDMARLTEHVGARATGGRQTILVSATLTPNVRGTELLISMSQQRVSS